jgi:hypothetical protein
MKEAADRSGIVALAEAIERSWNAGDVKSYARLYAIDARTLLAREYRGKVARRLNEGTRRRFEAI